MTSLRDFIPLEKLGEGSFSTVYKVKRVSDEKMYALKKVRMSSLKEKQRQNAVNQVRILASLESPYIIGYKESMYDEKLNILCIVMEYADGGDLQKRITEAQKQKAFINEKEIWKAIVHVLRGLQIMHAKGILHRDMKSANIFLSEGYYKLGDLNVSKVNKGRLAYTQTGTPYYASPQVWRDQPYDSKSDIWSFGCILYEMASLKPPFNGKDMESLYKNVQRGVYEKLPSCYSKDLDNIIALCLQKNPKMRPNCTDLLNNTIVKKYADRLNINQQEIKPSEKKQLLQTIKVPLGLKGLQNKLPKSKYQDHERSLSPRPAAESASSKKLELPFRTPERAPVYSPPVASKQQGLYSPPPINRTPQPNKPLYTHQKSTSEKVTYSADRLLNNDIKKNDSYRRQAEIREIQNSLLIKQREIQEYVNSQLRKRPVTSTPKTQQRAHAVNYSRNDDRDRIRNNISDNYDLRASNKRQVDYSSSRNPRKQYPINDYSAYQSKKKVESVGNVSYKRPLAQDYSKPIIKADVKRSYNICQNMVRANNYIPNKNDLRMAARPEMGKYRYNIMPSWWG